MGEFGECGWFHRFTRANTEEHACPRASRFCLLASSFFLSTFPIFWSSHRCKNFIWPQTQPIHDIFDFSLSFLNRVAVRIDSTATLPTRTMADPDRSISNGSCFYAPNKEASPNFIPCGNWIFGHVHCCQAGDMCLDDRACFNSRHGTTYLAGCSRFDYQHPSCPDKKPFEGRAIVMLAWP